METSKSHDSTSAEEQSDKQTQGTDMPALPDLTEQLELSLLAIFDCHERTSRADDDTSPFTLPSPAAVDEDPDEQSSSFEPCEFPAYRSHFVFGVMAPLDFHRYGATTFPA